jgi:hypothetical protein
MRIAKLFSLITPFVLVSLGGVIMILIGIFKPSKESNALQFIFGIPIFLGALGLHYLIVRMVRYNGLYVWLIEAVFVAIGCYGFLHS